MALHSRGQFKIDRDRLIFKFFSQTRPSSNNAAPKSQFAKLFNHYEKIKSIFSRQKQVRFKLFN